MINVILLHLSVVLMFVAGGCKVVPKGYQIPGPFVARQLFCDYKKKITTFAMLKSIYILWH